MATREGLADRRKALGLTQESLAELLEVERSTVARWEQGTATPRPWYRRRLADALQVTPDELNELLANQRPGQRAVDLAGDVHVTDLPISTRSPGSTAPPTDAEGVESFRADARRLIDLDTRHGGDALSRLAVRVFRVAHQRLASGLYVPGVERDLQATVGELGQISAWIAYDADDQALSRQLTNEAILASRLAGDRRMELFELAQLAMQSVHLGLAREALRVADAVIESDPVSPRVAAVFHLRRARALAQTGQRARALSEHDRAAAVLDGGITNRDPDWTWWLDHSELAWHRAMSLASLNEWPAALDLFQQAWSLRPRHAHRARYNDLAHMLDAQVALGTWNDAQASLAAVIADAHEVNSSRTTALLRRITKAILQADNTPPALTDSVHELHQLLQIPA